MRFRSLMVPAAGMAAMLAVAATAMPASADVESKDPIKLTLHDWTGQLITTNIMGEVLKKAGYNIEYVQADYIAQFAGLKSGDLHVAMEMWETTGRDAMDEATATGKVENLGETPQRLRRGLLDPRDGTTRALSRWAGDLGWLRRRACRGTGAGLRGSARWYGRGALRGAGVGLSA
jgi:ABC-type proline/glycine betaine transport system substrate-binding protein